MFSQRGGGRGGPSRSTPSNVQCQKCLKRDMLTFHVFTSHKLTFAARHYSYECKAPAAERPYVSRPSRTQQLRNPKLVPKLTEATPTPVERKKGVADGELAKAEAERAKKREREERDDEILGSTSKRQRSVSSHSVSTISTGISRSPSPVKERVKSPPRTRRGRSPDSGSDGSRRGGRESYSRSPEPTVRRRRSFARDSRTPEYQEDEPQHGARRGRGPESERGGSRRDGRESYSRSPEPASRRRRSVSRDSRSPDQREVAPRYRARDPVPQRYPEEDDEHTKLPRGQSPDSRSSVRSWRRGVESRSPEPSAAPRRAAQNRDAGGGQDQTSRGRGRGNAPRGPQVVAEPPRERSLSPFSRRLALTQSLNTGGR
ncbi:hypothetical protein G7046_g8212 [Stylonectria norvegica]|nr:hypothetical protein G7046_g8212 [Stylonectria norvegica]